MNRKLFLSVLAFVLALSASGQQSGLALTFTAINNSSYFQLDSITVLNRTQEGDTTLYWPDTVLVLDYHVGTSEGTPIQERLQVFQNYPNPMADQTTISLFIPEKDAVGILITDATGRMVVKSDRQLDRGMHAFRFTPGGGSLFFLIVQWRGERDGIRILKDASGSYGVCSLEYLGSDDTPRPNKAKKDHPTFPFSIGDELLCIGYGEALQSGMVDTLETSEILVFQFATNIPCPGTPTVAYEGKTYNTIQVFSQCWIKENLDVGIMIPGNRDVSDDGIIEKYCYDDNPEMCAIYGGLYQWKEMMQFSTHKGTQGICPPDWHIPTDEEWKVLEGAVDSQFGIGNNTWDDNGDRGIDAGMNLKATSGWTGGGNGTNQFGFSGLPGGYRHFYGFFDLLGEHGIWWSSTESDNYFSWFRNLGFSFSGVIRDTNFKEFGLSVRCLRD